MSHRRVLLLVALGISTGPIHAQKLDGRLTVHADKPGHAISPKFFGMMTEEINHAYDGGLYAELIRNRALTDDKSKPVFWSAVGDNTDSVLVLDKNCPVSGTVLTRGLRVDAGRATPTHAVGTSNAGYWGIPVKPKTRYKATFFARGLGGFRGPLTASIADRDGSVVIADAKVERITEGWRQYSVTFTTSESPSSFTNRFQITTRVPGVFELTQVSLFPPTFKNRLNGMRPDLMHLMAGLRPKFLRLPGGNYLEGNTIAERFDWKKTIGPISQRPGHPCPWGYPSTDGMGLLEFLEWCQDLRMEPLLGVFAGYALRGEHISSGPGLQPFVQDALDEIEYIAGSTSTKWGARRAKDGHPKPFPLHYVEIGNEDWYDRSQSYEGRFAQFFDALRKRFPKLKLIATMPVKDRVPDLIDDHFYRSADEMARDSGHYDSYSRKGPKIFVGEWATTEGMPTPHLRAALGDATWLTGMERNSDIVELEAYAPLFVNVNRGAWQWSTNLIGYDAGSSFGSPAYWVQALFGQNTGDHVLPYDLKVDRTAEKPTMYAGQAGVGTYRTDAEYKKFKVTVGGQTVGQDDFSHDAGTWKFGPGSWKIEDGVLHQTSDQRGTRALTGSEDWTDCTIEVKAKKNSGREGFFVLFHSKSDGSFWQWNVGGWNNTREAIQIVRGEGSSTEVGQSMPVKIESGRWYDLKVELKSGLISCYLDGKLIKQVRESLPTVEPVYVAASKVNSTGEVILKLVNVSDKYAQIQVDIKGLSRRRSDAPAWLLTGKPLDQNTVQEPNRVVPHRITIPGNSKGIKPTLPPHSLVVVRLMPG